MGGYFQTTKTDAGWNYNIGKSAWNIDVLAYKEIAQLPTPIQDRFISDMAQNRHFKDRFIIWANSIIENGDNKGFEEITLTWITPKQIKRIRKDGYKFNSPIVVIQDDQIPHSYHEKTPKQKLTQSEYLTMYDIINNYDELYYDITKYNEYSDSIGLVYVRLIPNSDKCIKVCTRFNEITKIDNKNLPITRVTTVAKVLHSSLGVKTKYKKIE